MATGRTVSKYARIYASGMGTFWTTRLCGLTRSLGPLSVAFDEVDATGMCDSVKGYLPGHAAINPGPINVILDPVDPGDGLGMFPNPSVSIGAYRYTIGEPMMIEIPIGIRAAPALGDPTFCGIFPFQGMTYQDDGGLVTVNFDLGSSVSNSYIPTYAQPWGQLLHPDSQESGVNSSGGADNGAATTNGGIMFLQIFATAGSATTFKVQHSTDNNTFADLTGASIVAATPGGYWATVAPNTTVNRYLRWQMTAVTNTFVMSFVRG